MLHKLTQTYTRSFHFFSFLFISRKLTPSCPAPVQRIPFPVLSAFKLTTEKKHLQPPDRQSLSHCHPLFSLPSKKILIKKSSISSNKIRTWQKKNGSSLLHVCQDWKEKTKETNLKTKQTKKRTLPRFVHLWPWCARPVERWTPDHLNIAAFTSVFCNKWALCIIPYCTAVN